MTIVVAFKVGDGLVMGADSASTMEDANGNYLNSYFNAEKLFHIVKGLPVGVMTFGLGGLANRSISSLINDLRRRMSDQHSEWYVNPENFTVLDVVNRIKAFFYDELYHTQFDGMEKAPPLGFLVGGFSSDSSSAEVWRLVMNDGACAEPNLSIPPDVPTTVVWDGQHEAIRRLVLGYSWDVVETLKSHGVDEKDALDLLSVNTPLVHASMPIQDAVDFVHYLIEVTCGYVRFCTGQATVAHPIDSAAITKHNGFKWIRRKHYYPADLNQ